MPPALGAVDMTWPCQHHFAHVLQADRCLREGHRQLWQIGERRWRVDQDDGLGCIRKGAGMLDKTGTGQRESLDQAGIVLCVDSKLYMQSALSWLKQTSQSRWATRVVPRGSFRAGQAAIHVFAIHDPPSRHSFVQTYCRCPL